jgi:hypothetical protein
MRRLLAVPVGGGLAGKMVTSRDLAADVGILSIFFCGVRVRWIAATIMDAELGRERNLDATSTQRSMGMFAMPEHGEMRGQSVLSDMVKLD